MTYLKKEFDSGPQFSWLDGERLASHGRVKTLHNDDGLELTSMERCLALMDPDVGFVFTVAMLSGPKKINVLFDNVFQRSGVFESRKDRRIVAKTVIPQPHSWCANKNSSTEFMQTGCLFKLKALAERVRTIS